MNPEILKTPTPAETTVKNRLLNTDTMGGMTPTDPNIASLVGTYNPQTIMDKYASARKLTEEGAAATAKRLESEYSTAKEDINIADTKDLTQSLEGQRGFAQMPVALNYMQAAHDKRIRDLTKQKNELLLSNDAEKARALSDLILKEETAITDARSKFLSDFFQASSFETPDQKAKRELANAGQQAVLSLMQTAPGAGITASDTYDSAIQKYKNSAEYKLNMDKGNAELARINADIAATRAATTKTLSGLEPAKPAAMSPMTQAVNEDKINTINNLITGDALKTATGPNALARFSLTNWATGERQNFVGAVEQLRGQLTLDTLQNAKAAGATFGALSNEELGILEGIGTKIKNWAKVDEDTKKIVGYSISEKEMRNELEKINNFTKLDYVLKGGDPAKVGSTITPDGRLAVKSSDGKTVTMFDLKNR